MVNYNGTREIRNCIDSIKKVIQNTIYELIVVDNNSQDRTIETLIYLYPDMKFELLKENLGYSKANNYGASLSQYDYLLFLNPDTIIIEDFISPFLRFCDSNERIGACGPMLLYNDMSYQNSCGGRLGIFYETAEAFMFINLYRKILRFFKKRKFNGTNPFRVGWLSGACLFIKKDIFRSIGGFDDQFFLNYEDIDLCEKLNKAGYFNYYFPRNKCIHLDQTTQKKDYESFTYSRYVSRLIYSKNHYGFFERKFVRFIHILGLFLRLLIVKFVYSGEEKRQRLNGYKRAVKLYI